MQQHPLLHTKLNIPSHRPDLVSRPRLIERLNDGFGHNHGFRRRLTLISAPAGFGKTTLVSEWVATSGRPACWLALDESDNDPARFLTYLVASLQTLALSEAEGFDLSEAEGFALGPDRTSRIEGPAARHSPFAAIGDGVLALLQTPGFFDPSTSTPIETILTPLINEIATLPGDFVLVLDDYHVIEATSVNDALTFLLEHTPPQMHLVIVTREDPNLRLSRLRARGQMAELRVRDLRFTLAEASEFFDQVMSLKLSAAQVSSLEARTEGWIAGLQLAALSMQGRDDVSGFIDAFTGDHRYIVDYLVEEVLNRQPEAIRSFLLQTSILDRLSGPLCDAVTLSGSATPDHAGRSDTLLADAMRFSSMVSPTGQATLEMLERANLFIVPLDEQRRWYRYHRLFGDLLRQRLREAHADLVPTLHRRASEWYEQHGLGDEAIAHALRGADFERAASLVAESADAVWEHGEHAKLFHWLEDLPSDEILSNPQLAIFKAWEHFADNQQAAAEATLQAAEKALDTHVEPATGAAPVEYHRLSNLDRIKIQGRAATVRAHLALIRGDVEGMRTHARQALEYLPRQDDSWRHTAAVAMGDAYSLSGDLASAFRFRSEELEAAKATGRLYVALVASMRLALTLRLQGKLDQVLELCRRQSKAVGGSGLSRVTEVGLMSAIWGEVLAERNDLDGALEKALMGKELTERDRDVGNIGWSYVCLTRVLFSRGDMSGSARTVQKMEGVFRDTHIPAWISARMAAWQVRIWLADDRLDSALHWAAQRGLEPDGNLSYLNGREYVALARILIAQERLDDALGLLQRLLEATEVSGNVSRRIEILILQALACQAMGHTSHASGSLQRALTSAEPGGFVRAFVDEGPPMERLLNSAAAQGIKPDYSRDLLATFPGSVALSAGKSKTETQKSEIVEPLSERELEVLQLIALGLSNREISERLFLALSTVKGHNQRIYGKLGVQRRTEAVARARELRLL